MLICYFFQISMMNGWTPQVLDNENDLLEVEMDITLNEGVGEIQAILPDSWSSGLLFYFSAPRNYLGNQVNMFVTFIYAVVSVKSVKFMCFECKLSLFSIQPGSRMISVSNDKYSNESQLCSCCRIAVSESFQLSSIARILKCFV